MTSSNSIGAIKRLIKRVPILRDISVRAANAVLGRFSSSASYWEKRYSSGGSSGPGSYRHLARFKADVLNQFVAEHRIDTVIEFGCGDGNQLSLATYPPYIGFDVSATAIDMCRKRFHGDSEKTFKLMSDYSGERADLTLSLDVIFHLVEDDVFEEYMRTLFSAARRFVIIYSSDTDDIGEVTSVHVKHRKFTDFVAEHFAQWRLRQRIENKFEYDGVDEDSSFSDFYIYERLSDE